MSAARPHQLHIDGKTYEVQVKSLSADKATVMVNGKAIEVDIEVARPAPRATPKVVAGGSPASAPRARPQSAPMGGRDLRAMMPGVITRVLVEAGQEVASGEVLVVLEAMKMENEIRSDRAGKIAAVQVTAGQKVQTGDVMITFEA